MPGIMAFDVAKVTGVAYADETAVALMGRGALFAAAEPSHPQVRRWNLGGAGDEANRLFGRVVRAIEELRPQLVAIEAVHVGVNAQTALTVGALNTAAFLGARHAGVPPSAILRPQPSTWRKTFLGHARGATKALKAETQDVCRARGWSFRDDNEADALGILDWACGVSRSGQ